MQHKKISPETSLRISPHLIMRKHRDGTIVYNSLYGQPAILNRQCQWLLTRFKRPKSWVDVERIYTIDDSVKWLRFFTKNHMLIPWDCDERQDIKNVVERAVRKIAEGSSLVSLGLMLDERCNFDCVYCMSLKMLKVSERTMPGEYRMAWSIARMAVDKFMGFANEKAQEKVEIYFGGSEPLLNWELMKQVIEYCQSEYGHNHTFTFSANSNLSLINKEKAEFLGKNKVTITTSLDGPEVINDKVRRLASGGGTFKRILKGWDLVSQHSQQVEWFILTLTDDNIDEIDEGFFDFLKARGITACSFEPDLVSSLKKPPGEVVAALMRFRQWAKQRGISLSGMWEKPYHNIYEADVGKKMFNCSAFTGRGISVSPPGYILPCAYSATKLAHIRDFDRLFGLENYRSLIMSRAIGNISECQGCEIEGQCLGGCYITTEYAKYAKSDEAFKYRCEINRQVTRTLLDKKEV